MVTREEFETLNLHQSITGLTNGGTRSTCLGCGHYEDSPPKEGDRVFGKGASL